MYRVKSYVLMNFFFSLPNRLIPTKSILGTKDYEKAAIYFIMIYWEILKFDGSITLPNSQVKSRSALHWFPRSVRHDGRTDNELFIAFPGTRRRRWRRHVGPKRTIALRLRGPCLPMRITRSCLLFLSKQYVANWISTYRY